MMDEYELSADGVDETWNFPQLANSENGQAGLIYGIEQRDVSAPYIDNGLAIIPPPGGGGTTLTGVEYSSTATVPGINGTVIVHPYADDSKSGGGVIKSIKASSVDAPYIDNGEIVIPEIPEMPEPISAIKGVLAMDGTMIDIDNMPEPGEEGILMSYYYWASYKYDLYAWAKDGYLSFQIVHDQSVGG